MPIRLGYLTAVLVLAIAAGCSETGTVEPGAEGTATESIEQSGALVGETAEPTGGPTVVSRAGPQMTASAAAKQWEATEVEGIPGVVVPGGAELVQFAEASGDSDAQAVYEMQDAEAGELREWFETQFVPLGWGEPTLSDGSLVFKHSQEFSERFQRQGLRRTATVHFFESSAEEPDEGQDDGGEGVIEIHLIVEEPAPAD